MAYLAPIHRPSSVRHALKLNFLSPDEECLVVAKANRLEFYSQTPDGLSLQHSKALYGKVTMLNKLHPASAQTDHLFVGTDRYMYFTLSWDASVGQLKTEKSYVDQSDKTSRDAQAGDRCQMDPSGKFMTLELHEGIITVVPIVQKSRKKTDAEIGSLADPIPARVPEFFIRSSTFLDSSHAQAKPKLALLYEDAHKKVRIRIRELNFTPGGSGDPGAVELKEVDSPREELELGASHLIPVPAPTSGYLVLGETSVTYFSEPAKRPTIKPLDQATIFVTWEQIDPQRFLLADDYGKLYLLMLLLRSDNSVESWRIDEIGATSRATTLVYLDNGIVFVGSHQGDSQLIQIVEQNIEILQTFPNIAPILDFTIMDMGNRTGEGQANEYSSGQARIVTGSGAFSDGSLRSVRSGVGIEDLGLLGEMEHVRDVFSLNTSGGGSFVDTLVVSFVDETRVFRFSQDGEVEEVDEFKGLVFTEGTLFAGNVREDKVVQITPSSVLLIDPDSGTVLAQWSPSSPGVITIASANQESIVLSVGGVSLVVLDIASDLSVTAQKTYGADSQIACLTVPFSTSAICAVGFWQDASISILKLSTLEVLQTETVGQEGGSVPRSILIANLFHGLPPTLFVAMADGQVVTFSLNTETYALTGRKSIVLGTQQANFKALPRGDGLLNVFATCEHPSLIYGSEGRIVYSAVTAENASCVCPFDSEAYPGSIVLATATDLRIALIDTERTTHVQTLPVHETVRRVAYSPKLRAFGLGTIRRTLEDGEEIVKSHFKLADEIMFQELDTYALNDDELVESVIRAELDNGRGDLEERFVVGTAYLDDEKDETIRGRIIVLEVTEDRQLKLVTELAVKGACRALALLQDKIVAALIKTVVVYGIEYKASSQPLLVKQASYRTATAPIDIAITGNLIVVADLMKSVSVVEYHRGKNGLSDSLKEVARHFQTAWGTAVAHVADDTFLESDAEGNLMVLHQNTNGITDDDKRRLEITSEMQLGEMVNRIRRINVDTTPEASVIPRAFLATVEGAIYLFALIQPDRQNLLMRLQANMANFVQSPGNVPFHKYRAFRNQVREADEPFRFVDGELIERFLDVSESLQEQIVEGLNIDVEAVRGIVEGLRRLH